MPSSISVPGLPALDWLAAEGNASVENGVLHMVGGPRTNWFNDPATQSRDATAPVLAFPANEDCQLAARVRVGFAETFDAGLLLVRQTDDDYAKLCLERSPDAEHMVVSVVTRGTSDDANGPLIDGDAAHLRVSRIGPAFAFHYSLDGHRWHLVRLFRLRDPDRPTVLGFCAQSPLGDRCEATFSDISYRLETLTNPRDGS